MFERTGKISAWEHALINKPKITAANDRRIEPRTMICFPFMNVKPLNDKSPFVAVL